MSWFRGNGGHHAKHAKDFTQPSAKDGALDVAEQGLQRLLALGGDLVACISVDAEVFDCSFCENSLHGLVRDDLLQAGFLQRLHVADRPSVWQALDVAGQQDARQRAEFRLRVGDDEQGRPTYVWFEMTAQRLAKDDDQGRILALCRDIDDAKRREEQLAAALRAAQEANEAKNRFLNNMSHELRTPLNAIIGFSEMMCMPGILAKNERQMNEYAGIIHNSGKHLLGLVDEVLDMSRLETGKYKLSPEPCRLADLLENCLEKVQREAEDKHIRIKLAEFDPELEMMTDRRALRQLLVNLLARQIKQTREKGRLRLSVTVENDIVGFLVETSAGDGEPVEQPLQGSLIEALTALMQGEVKALDAVHGDSAMQLKLPRCHGSRQGGQDPDNVVHLAANPSNDPADKQSEQPERPEQPERKNLLAC